MHVGKLELYEHQLKAISELGTGRILCGAVGSGKSLTAVSYFYTRECGGDLDQLYHPMSNPKDLYIITTAKKRDTGDWERECSYFPMLESIAIVVDSWNNIEKYSSVKNAFFIFDEQRVVGSGSWVKSFLKITKENNWILLSATPGDTWTDYIPVFVANGFYKNRTDFIRNHIVYKRYIRYPVIDRYIDTMKLERLKNSILVQMPDKRLTIPHHETIAVEHNKALFKKVYKDYWNPYLKQPAKDVSERFALMRRVVNSDLSRISAIRTLLVKHQRLIIFYNYDYELEILRTLPKLEEVVLSEYNGHKHEDVPKGPKWVYLVQYNSGAEGWNCITTNAIVFYSLNYSYRMMVQAAGRVDRINTPYLHLFYYYLKSASWIDLAISRALAAKKDFNERSYR